MKKLKQIPMAMIMLGLGAASSFAEIKLNDNFSLTGFLDMSALGVVPKDGDNTLTAEFDQFELDFLYKYGFFSARADINYVFANDPNVTFEQGFVTANLLKDLNFTVGKFLSSSGFEAAEPTGLYQYSYSKLMDPTTAAGMVYGGYQNGANISYVNPMFGLYGAVVTNVWGNSNDLMYPGFEGQLSLTPIEGLTAKVTWLTQLYNDTANTGHENQNELNAWASFAKGPLTIAGEYSYLINWVNAGLAEQNGQGWLVMANFKATDKIAATVRYSGIKMDDIDDVDQETTFSPSFAVSPNWLTLAEVKYEYLNDIFSYAFESTYSF
jgi:hypothetical protein